MPGGIRYPKTGGEFSVSWPGSAIFHFGRLEYRLIILPKKNTYVELPPNPWYPMQIASVADMRIIFDHEAVRGKHTFDRHLIGVVKLRMIPDVKGAA